MSFDDVVFVLGRSKNVGRKRALWLRRRIWWNLNDRYRTRYDGSPLSDVPAWPPAAERSNMEAILDMLRDGDGDGDGDGETRPRAMVEQGELLRLLGRFDQAVAILKAVPANGHDEVRAVRIERLARNRDTQVRMLSLPTW